MSGLALPPAEPPADDVAELLEQIRQAREELTDAGRIVHMLDAGDEEDLVGHPLRRQVFETIVAERRCELWAAALADLEQQAREKGLQP